MHLTDAYLRKYASEHVAYEVQMLFKVSRVATSNSHSQFLMNMLVESFGLHLRNLITFLYPTNKQYSTDMISLTEELKPILQLFCISASKSKLDTTVQHMGFEANVLVCDLGGA